MKTLALLRVSTDRQSIDAQALAIGRWASAHRLEVDARVEPEMSGASKDRPVLEAIMLEARAGQVATLVVAALDRLGRSTVDTVLRLEELHALGVRVVSLREGFDLATPVGKFTATILAALAEMEREQIRARTKASLDALREREKAGGAKSHIGNPALRWTPEADKELEAALVAGKRPEQIAAAKTLTTWRRRAVDASGRAASATGKPAVGYGEVPSAPSATAIRKRLKALGLDVRGVPVATR